MGNLRLRESGGERRAGICTEVEPKLQSPTNHTQERGSPQEACKLLGRACKRSHDGACRCTSCCLHFSFWDIQGSHQPQGLCKCLDLSSLCCNCPRLCTHEDGVRAGFSLVYPGGGQAQRGSGAPLLIAKARVSERGTNQNGELQAGPPVLFLSALDGAPLVWLGWS